MGSWKTTVGGILLGVPPIVQAASGAAGISLGKWGAFVITLSMGLGGLILGTSAKDSTTHSTQTEVAIASLPIVNHGAGKP